MFNCIAKQSLNTCCKKTIDYIARDIELNKFYYSPLKKFTNRPFNCQMQHITIYDYLLLPLYLFLFYFLVKRRSIRFEDIELRKIFLIAFGLRMLGSIVYSLMVQYYYGYGDAFTYYVGGNFLIEQIQTDFSNIKYLFAPASELQHLY